MTAFHFLWFQFFRADNYCTVWTRAKSQLRMALQNHKIKRFMFNAYHIQVKALGFHGRKEWSFLWMCTDFTLTWSVKDNCVYLSRNSGFDKALHRKSSGTRIWQSFCMHSMPVKKLIHNSCWSTCFQILNYSFKVLENDWDCPRYHVNLLLIQ